MNDKNREVEELIGNPVRGILHGGVISSVLDATGGMTGAIKKFSAAQ